MKHKTLLTAIVIFIILPLSIYFLIKRQNKKELQWYQTGKAITKDLSQSITASGRLKAQDEITIGSLVAGRVVKLLVDDNDLVKKDQVLVELDDGIGYSAVKKAKANLLQAQANLVYLEAFYARQKELFHAGQLAKDTFESYTKDYETVKASVLSAQSDLEISQKTYANLFIKAPEQGIVIAKKVNLGQMVTAQFQATELFIIAKDLTKMEAEIDVDEADIGVVKVGQDAIFTVDSFPQKLFSAKITQINYDYKIVDNVITYGVILDVSNPYLTLRPGMTTNVNIKVADEKQALCIPNRALRVSTTIMKKIAEKEHFSLEELAKTVETKTQETVWIVHGKIFKEVYVRIGVTDGKVTQITQGITAEDILVLEALDPERENPILAVGKLRV